MKTHNLHSRKTIPALIIALGLGCLALPRMAHAADPSIVGLWRVHYFFDNGTEFFQSFKQWHADGLEIEIANLFGASCNGTFKVRPDGTVELFHVGWLFDQNGQLVGSFKVTETNRVGREGKHYSGTWHEKDYDTAGNLVNEYGGTLRATRLPAN